MRYSFTVDGNIQPKERPRVKRFNGRITTYTPAKTKLYESKVKASYNGSMYAENTPLKVMIVAYMPIPKSTSKKQHEAMLSGRIRPTKTPDADNIAKSICDALNGVAYKDDKQIIRLTVEKWYSDFPRAEVTIDEVAW